jgi:hypothetical protein
MPRERTVTRNASRPVPMNVPAPPSKVKLLERPIGNLPLRTGIGVSYRAVTGTRTDRP